MLMYKSFYSSLFLMIVSFWFSMCHMFCSSDCGPLQQPRSVPRGLGPIMLKGVGWLGICAGQSSQHQTRKNISLWTYGQGCPPTFSHEV